jgi:hypothetical protein
LEEQRQEHGKLLFTVTELAHVAGTSRNALNVELTRLRRQGAIVQYAQGRYGLPGGITLEILLPAVDSHAYVTGSYALHVHNLITQLPAHITCFTDRRSPRERATPVGRFAFVCVRSRVYSFPRKGVVAPPAQALCDFVFLMRRKGVLPEGVVTFRSLAERVAPELDSVLNRYPSTVQRHVRALVAGEGPSRRPSGEDSRAAPPFQPATPGGVMRVIPPM